MSVYVQIGAGAGDEDPSTGFRDGFTEMVKDLPREDVSRVVLVEPNPLNIPALTRFWSGYPQAEIHNLGIRPDAVEQSEITFYYAPEDGPTFQVFSMNPGHVLAHYPDTELRTEVVPCLTLTQFLSRVVGDDPIELLALDIEGIDAQVLLETDWDGVNCRRLSFEHLHMGEALKSVADRLNGAGFAYIGTGVDHNGYDMMFARPASARR